MISQLSKDSISCAWQNLVRDRIQPSGLGEWTRTGFICTPWHVHCHRVRSANMLRHEGRKCVETGSQTSFISRDSHGNSQPCSSYQSVVFFCSFLMLQYWCWHYNFLFTLLHPYHYEVCLFWKFTDELWIWTAWGTFADFPGTCRQNQWLCSPESLDF